MARKDLEQDGDEDFKDYDTREKTSAKTIIVEALKKKDEELEKEQEQAEWLSPFNDELWTNF